MSTISDRSRLLVGGCLVNSPMGKAGSRWGGKKKSVVLPLGTTSRQPRSPDGGGGGGIVCVCLRFLFVMIERDFCNYYLRWR